MRRIVALAIAGLLATGCGAVARQSATDEACTDAIRAADEAWAAANAYADMSKMIYNSWEQASVEHEAARDATTEIDTRVRVALRIAESTEFASVHYDTVWDEYVVLADEASLVREDSEYARGYANGYSAANDEILLRLTRANETYGQASTEAETACN